MSDHRADNPSAYHITHEDNLAGLFDKGFLYCDSFVRQHNITHIPIGYKHTKQNRLEMLIPIASNLCTGDCVPLYYCPRSVMLYVIYRNDSEDLATHCGEDPVIHLRFNVRKVWQWAQMQNLRFITNANAAAQHAEVFADVRALGLLNWEAISSRYWSEESIKTDKAAELLIENRLSLELLEEIGVKNETHQAVVNDILSKYPQYRAVPVNVRDWYYGR